MMTAYYVSRGILSIAFGGLVYLFSGYPLAGVLGAVLPFSIFLYLPKSGRYMVVPKEGTTALRRDEFTQSVNQRSGLYAWVVVAVAGGVLVLYYGLISPGGVPVSLLGLLLLAGMVTYYVSDYLLRR
jgi:hypothetical protein